MPGDSVIAISATGLEYQYKKLEVIANNLSNMGVAGTKAGAIYTPLDVVSYSGTEENENTNQLVGVAGYDVVERNVAPKNVFEPNHPEADAAGYVQYPDIDHLTEMTSLIVTTRAYEANLKAIQAAKAMSMKALEIGRK